MSDEREKWMPSVREIENAIYLGHETLTSGRVERLIRRAARDRAIEELERLLDGQHWSLEPTAVKGRIAALRAEGERG